MKFIPVYTTRPDADGETGTISVNMHLAILAWVIFYVNVVVWGISSLLFWLYIVFS